MSFKIPKRTPNGREISFSENEILVSKTDLKGRITYGNRRFIELTGFSEQELLGAPHNIIRHPDMPKAAFKLVWDTIQKGEEINAYVINLAKDGSHYWVYANITPSFADDGKTIIGYHSTRRVPNKDTINNIIKPLYAKMLSAEQSGGIEAGVAVLMDVLKEKGVHYDELVCTI